MVSKNRIRFVCSLHQKKFREETGLFLVEGEKLVEELLRSEWKYDALYATSEWLSKWSEGLPGSLCEEVGETELEKMSVLKTPNKVLALVRVPLPTPFSPNPQANLMLALDEIKDPGNLGTMIRLADWFGIRQVISSPGTVELYNPKTVQATMGSIFRVKLVYTPLEGAIKQAKEMGFRINAAVLGGDNIFQLPAPGKEIILLGNESHGISNNLLRLSDRRIGIPPHPDWSGAESLNVSMAAAILCAEFRRAELKDYSK